MKESLCLDFPSPVWDRSCFASKKNTFSVRQESEDLLLADADNNIVFEVVANLGGLDNRKIIQPSGPETSKNSELALSSFKGVSPDFHKTCKESNRSPGLTSITIIGLVHPL